MPSPEIVRKAFDDFFDSINPLPRISFLNEPSLRLSFNRGEADPALILSICANCALYLWSGDARNGAGSEWISAAEDIILKDLDHPSVSRVQAILLVIQHRLESRCYSKAFMLIPLAARGAFGFRLNYEHENLPFQEQEIRRRVMWAVWATEKLWSGGLTEFELCQDRVMNIQLPCREEDFERGTPVFTEHLQRPPQSKGASSHGLLGHCLRLIGMRNAVLINNKRLLNQECQPTTALELVRDVEDELRRLKATFGSDADFTSEQLQLYASSRRLARYVMVHTSWHQCNCDNYRIFLTGYPRAISSKIIERVDPAFVEYSQRKCLDHALAMIEIFTDLLNFPSRLPVMDTDLAMCAFHSARIIHYIHWRNPRKTPLETDRVFKRLQICVDLVKRAFPNSPTTSVYLQDLEYLATHPISKDVTSNRQSPEPDNQVSLPKINPVPEAKSRQLLERHSLIRLANFVNDSPLPAEQPPPLPQPSAQVDARGARTRRSITRQTEPQQSQTPLPPLPALSSQASSLPTDVSVSAPPLAMMDDPFQNVFPIPSTAPPDLGQWEGAFQAPWDHLDVPMNPNVYTQGSFDYFGAPGVWVSGSVFIQGVALV